MEPNFYGLIKQSQPDLNADLLALFFPEISNIDDLSFETILLDPSAFEADKRWNLAASGYTKANRVGAKAGEFIFDIDQYDMFIIHSSMADDTSSQSTSGLYYFVDDTPFTNGAGDFVQAGGNSMPGPIYHGNTAYLIATIAPSDPTVNKVHIYITSAISKNLPIIGIKKKPT